MEDAVIPRYSSSISGNGHGRIDRSLNINYPHKKKLIPNENIPFSFKS